MKTVITIHNIFEQLIDQGMLEKVLIKCEWFIPSFGTLDQNIDIYTKPRDSKGWIEWAMVINDQTDREMYIGCIQREPGGEYEFCS
jgi:hypothetical protein